MKKRTLIIGIVFIVVFDLLFATCKESNVKQMADIQEPALLIELEQNSTDSLSVVDAFI
jgi:hypothetical protein